MPPGGADLICVKSIARARTRMGRRGRCVIHLTHPPEKKSELKAFLFLTVVMAPVLAGVIIGVYGLAVWIYQMFAGPPTG